MIDQSEELKAIHDSFVVMVGNPIDGGFRFYGPFHGVDYETVCVWAEMNLEYEWWVAELRGMYHPERGFDNSVLEKEDEK